MTKREQKRFAVLEEKVATTEAILSDLIEYMTRTNILPHDVTSFRDWRDNLNELRHNDKVAENINEAKFLLKKEGFIVVRNDNEIAAAKLKHWMTDDA